MTIHWSLFVPGVLLLLFPANWLLSSAVELHSFDWFHRLENSPRYRPWWWVPVLWLDPLRGFLGTILLLHSLALTLAPWERTSREAYWLAITILALASVCQILTRRGEPGTMLAPIGFVAGVVCALTPWPAALLSIVVGGVGLFAFRQFHVFFTLGSVAIALLGFALDAEAVWIAAAAGAFALPIVAVLVTGSTLELPTRNASRPRPSV